MLWQHDVESKYIVWRQTWIDMLENASHENVNTFLRRREEMLLKWNGTAAAWLGLLFLTSSVCVPTYVDNSPSNTIKIYFSKTGFLIYISNIHNVILFIIQIGFILQRNTFIYFQEFFSFAIFIFWQPVLDKTMKNTSFLDVF